MEELNSKEAFEILTSAINIDKYVKILKDHKHDSEKVLSIVSLCASYILAAPLAFGMDHESFDLFLEEVGRRIKIGASLTRKEIEDNNGGYLH